MTLDEDGEVTSRESSTRLRRQPALLRPARPGRPGALPGRCRRSKPVTPVAAWPVIGNFPDGHRRIRSRARRRACLDGRQHQPRLRDDDRDHPAGAGDPAELWTITVENLSDAPRQIKVVPYLEWVLNRPDADRGHTQYNRLFAEMEYVERLHAVLAWDKHSKAMGFLASDAPRRGS